jgi:hypothetical protein
MIFLDYSPSPRVFPNTDIQLCTVHMQRNAKTHLSKTDAAEFQQRWRAIKSSWNLEVANQQFELLCDRFAKPIPLSSANCAKSASITWPFSIARNLSAAPCRPPTWSKPLMVSSKSCAATAAAISIPRTS